MQTSPEDTHSLLQEARGVFEPGNDVDTVMSVQRAITDIAEVRARQLDGLKATIRGTLFYGV